MAKLLITGASGNIGYEIVRGLKEINTSHEVIAADFNTDRSQTVLKEFEGLGYRLLDFSNPATFDAALENIDVVFLLRPPHLADIPKYFAPFIEAMKKKSIHKIVFLSVQGVETQKMIPHHKIENLIRENNLEYAFLRPGYFMQNLTTTLLHEIKTYNKIYIPSGNLKFVWTDARDIGLVGAHILNDFEKYKNHPYEITGSEFSGFQEVADILSEVLGKTITYDSPNLMRFFREKRKLGMAKNMIFVMIMLHYLPRFGKNLPRLTDIVKSITGREPGTIKSFVQRDKVRF